MKFLRVFLAVLLSVIALTGCFWDDDVTEIPNTFDVPGADEGTEILVISSDGWKFYDQQKEIAAQLETVVNSGKYNITEVKTSYSDGYLTSAEVRYNKDEGEGNKIRLRLALSNNWYWGGRITEVKTKFQMLQESDLDVIELKTIYLEGELLAAEAYYWSDE